MQFGMIGLGRMGSNLVRRTLNAGHDCVARDVDTRSPRCGSGRSVAASWLLDLTAAMLRDDPTLDGCDGWVSESGEGRRTVQAAVDVGVPAHVLTAASYERFRLRGEADYGDRILSAVGEQFGGHDEQAGSR